MGRRVAIAGTARRRCWCSPSWPCSSRNAGCRRSSARPAAQRPRRPPRRPSPAAPGRKIKARLFYVADDGTRLTSVERDVAFGEGAVEQAREIVAAQIAPVAEPLVSAIPPGTTLRAVFITRTGDAFVDLEPRGARRASRRLASTSCSRSTPSSTRSPSNLPAVTARADAGRRQGSRHARRPRRPAAAAREKSRRGSSRLAHMRSDQRPADQLRDTTLTPDFPIHAEGSVLIERGQHEGDLHRERRGSRAAVPAQHRQGLGHRRVRHAAARHQHAHAARGDAGQGRRPDAGDSAADRPIAALGHQPAGARRAHDLDRLRRHPGRRRHAHRVDHRRLRRAGAGAREAARARRHPHDPAHRLRRRDQRRHRRRRAAARSRLRGRLARPTST